MNILFAPETFNLAETTRCIEIAKACDFAECLFCGYSQKFSSLIIEAGFEFQLLQPELTSKKIEQMMKFDQGKTLLNPFDTNFLRQRVTSEKQLIAEKEIDLVVIGTTLSMMISARAMQCPLIYAKPFAYSKEFFLQKQQGSFIDKRIARVALKLSYLPKSFRIIAKESGVTLAKTFDLMEGDWNLITTPAFLTGTAYQSENYQEVGPIFAHLKTPLTMELAEWLAKDNLVYVALGSSGDKRTLKKLLSCLMTFKEWSFICPVKSYLTPDEQAQYTTDNCLITDWLDATTVSKKAVFSILHGGEGTVQTASVSGKPFIGIPMQAEQAENILQLEKYGNAILLKKHQLNVKKLKQAIQQMSSPQMQAKAKDLQKKMQPLDGAKASADFIRAHFYQE